MINNIKSERARLGLTQSALAEQIGVDEGTIGRWERGSSDIPGGKVLKMSELFGCTTDYLFCRTEERVC